VVLSVGFLNDMAPQRLASYLSGYDAVIIGPDADLRYPLELVQQLHCN
jgi:hypothetical protein